jgi:hypothetical protein
MTSMSSILLELDERLTERYHGRETGCDRIPGGVIFRNAVQQSSIQLSPFLPLDSMALFIHAHAARIEKVTAPLTKYSMGAYSINARQPLTGSATFATGIC